ncbi:MAG TPA: hypothetical protein PK358_02340 [Spirochaetota bacterium]|nr:hypothetical protein [Spirochaetota bacterium]HPJ33645.1 hypothetical protein [Spirochaetota bacterium]
MSDDYIEKDFDDEVYEDDYYEEHYNEEELTDLDEFSDEDDDSDEGDEERGERRERKVHISYACEDCDYRWDDVVIKKRDEFEEDLETDVICPMCGSANITLI